MIKQFPGFIEEYVFMSEYDAKSAQKDQIQAAKGQKKNEKGVEGNLQSVEKVAMICNENGKIYYVQSQDD